MRKGKLQEVRNVLIRTLAHTPQGVVVEQFLVEDGNEGNSNGSLDRETRQLSGWGSSSPSSRLTFAKCDSTRSVRTFSVLRHRADFH